MHIVIYASGIPFNGDTIKTSSLGGSESAAYYAAKELGARGHRVVVFTESKDTGKFDGVTYLHTGERTQKSPMGSNWHFYCENTPHDVNIIQRVPHGFAYAIQSKINLWWAHDIALKRNNDHFMGQTWQTSRVMPVSHWFKEQIADNWLCDPARISPIHNGVDYSIFDELELKANNIKSDDKTITMLYCSRPERGLENLVMPGGIMEQLQERAPHIQLKVCGYEHPDADNSLGGFYGMLREQVEALPNCEHMGALTKKELYTFMAETADVWCYPTQFEEVSCITAMEVMGAGMSIFTTPTAALPETLGDYENCVLIPNKEDGSCNVDRFVQRLSDFDNKFRRRPRRDYTWSRVADEITEVIEDCFSEANSNIDAVARHYLRNSDITALEHLPQDKVSIEVKEQLPLYDFRKSQKAYAKHYADGTEEMYDGPNFNYEPPQFKNHPRFIEVAKRMTKLTEGSNVIDYGCAHGHFTNYLAEEFPHLNFTGIDVSPAAVKCAENKAGEMGLKNVRFLLDDWLSKNKTTNPACDALILGEILEHVPDPVGFMDVVSKKVGVVPIIITTPFGPWEEMSYQKEHPKRFHIHHFERGDLQDLFEGCLDFSITCVTASNTPQGESIGWYVTDVKIGQGQSVGHIDYERKFNETRPRQTVSFCMIVRNGEYDIGRLLNSIEPVVDEILIGVDETTTDNTIKVIEDFQDSIIKSNRCPRLTVTHFPIKSPLVTGFDAARNSVTEKALCDWIMWGDADEEFFGQDRVAKYLRPNGWRGYGVAQHHFSVEPTTVLSTDFPVRLYRNTPDIKFLGVVHKHPESVNTPNDGVGYAWVNRELNFAHGGYAIEDVRRKRFERNVGLMARDREENPNRILGKFLWIRDLALMNRFELESNGGNITPEMQQRAILGLALWEDTLDENGDHPQVKRMIRDHLEFYDVLVNCMDRGFTFRFKWSSGPNTSAAQLAEVPELSARFLNKRHLDKFLSVLINDEVKSYEERYL
jgi:glycosyltransferase involved in cell wall biosynthesis